MHIRLTLLFCSFVGECCRCSLVKAKVCCFGQKPARFLNRLRVKAAIIHFLGNFALLVYVVLQCTILITLYTTGIMTAIVQHEPSDNPFAANDFPRALQSKKYIFLTNNPQGVMMKQENLLGKDAKFF